MWSIHSKIREIEYLFILQVIQKELVERQEEKRLQDEELTEFIHSETKAVENRINLENLESAIEEAMNNPIDYEYAIDRNGYIYR